MRFSDAIIIIISSHFFFATMMISVCAIDRLSNFWGPHPDASTGRPRFQPSSGGRGCSCSPPPPPPPDFPYSWGSHPPPPSSPKVIVVGGKDKYWSFGTNYTDWAIKAARSSPFYVEDVLEFDFPLPVARRSFNHSVVLLKDRKSFERCDLSGSLKIANEYAGGTPGGFKFLLEMKPPSSDPFYYFACGEGNGDHCDKGNMKFAIMPVLH